MTDPEHTCGPGCARHAARASALELSTTLGTEDALAFVALVRVELEALGATPPPNAAAAYALAAFDPN